MKKYRLIALFLSVALLSGCLSLLTPLSASAEEGDVETGADPNAFADYDSATDLAMTSREYASAQEYLDKFMELRVTSGAYQLYANPFTGEVALKNRLTHQILSTNPINFLEDEETKLPDATKEKLLSQVVISYKDETGTSATMNSFTEAAKRGQIVIRDIKKGIRVEYIIGRLDTTYLLPGYIMKDRFESEILGPIVEQMEEQLAGYGAPAYDPAGRYTQVEYFQEMASTYSSTEHTAFQNTYFAYMKIVASYALNDPNANVATSTIESMQEVFPITAEKDEDGKFYAIYTLATDIRDNGKSTLEGYIKQYCPDYGYDDLEADHDATMYVAEDVAQPLFRLALEYVLEEDGMQIRLPSGGIRYDETFITLNDIMITPYFGAGVLDKDTESKDGYIFFPDGTGSIMEFADLYNEHVQVSVARTNQVYGPDYAYYSVEGSQHQETIRMPVYGLVDTEKISVPLPTETEGEEPIYMDMETMRGFLAIVTEGDALTDIAVEFGATTHPFASVYSQVTPRPSDEYSLENAISASGSSDQKWTVVSERKYTGNYTTKIVMLTDKVLGDELIVNPDNNIDSYYRADWVGMAHAYRDYLVKNGVINRLTETKSQLPLYLETFGSFETTEKIMSMPVTVDKALTSFADVQKMYLDLKTAGITNVNFRLVGFANGGMDARYPVKLKWEKAVGGSDGFEDLLADAAAKGYGVYPDFDFLYIGATGMFDGISEKDSSVRTVDDRYASKQIYDAVYQDFFTYFDICVASSHLTDFYDTFAEKYGDYEAKGISLALLATDLNSNFDEDDPTTREDAKNDYVQLLKKAAEKYSVMSEGGNIYAVTYTDHMLNMPIESSNYSTSSHTVPFLGMVLHGYVNMAGSALNEAGDVNYNIMRSIENGMAPYYILSYNSKATSLLKQDIALSQYYSIRYDIWFGSGVVGTKDFKAGELLNQYNLLNAAIGDLQKTLIDDYNFLVYKRQQKPEEIEADEAKLLAKIDEAIYQSAYDLEAQRIRLFRRDLDIYDALKAADASIASDATDRAAQLTNALTAYLLEVEYLRSPLYARADIDAVLATFVSAYKTAPETFADTLDLDPMMAASVAVQGDLVAAFRLQNDGAAPTKDADALRAAAEKYVARMAADYTARYMAGTFTADTGKTVAVAFDRASVIASIEEIIGASLNAAQLQVVDRAIAAYTKTEGDALVTVSEITMSAEDFEFTDYAMDDGRCSMVTYKADNGKKTHFVLNYNLFTAEVEYTQDTAFTVSTFTKDGTKTTVSYNAGDVVELAIPAHSFVRID